MIKELQKYTSIQLASMTDEELEKVNDYGWYLIRTTDKILRYREIFRENPDAT